MLVVPNRAPKNVSAPIAINGKDDNKLGNGNKLLSSNNSLSSNSSFSSLSRGLEEVREEVEEQCLEEAGREDAQFEHLILLEEHQRMRQVTSSCSIGQK